MEKESSSVNAPQHISEIHPGIRVLHRQIRAFLPEEPPILLEEALERAAAGSAVEPDGDFIHRIPDRGLKYEEKRS